MSTQEKTKTSSLNRRGDGAAHPADKVEMPADVFDPIDLRDRVVIKLLFEQVIQIEQVEAAWHRWKALQREGKSEELWRVLAAESEINQDR
ncbi:MAG TPA: hypothetical protein VKP65_07970, partial [Rhodothermales bacterium]|nr:hypothetical protein [Rhodothermales bacterium]